MYFRRVHAPYESTFGAYYRVLYAILDRIRDDGILSEEEKIIMAIWSGASSPTMRPALPG